MMQIATLMDQQSAQKLHEQIIQRVGIITLSIYDMGSFLKKMKEGRGFRFYAETWDEYVKMLGLARKTAYNYLLSDQAWMERVSKLAKDRPDLLRGMQHSYM